MRLGRTNLEHPVKDVLAPYAVECIVEKLRPAGRNLPFSLSRYASNKGNRKLFLVAVRFYDVNGAGITDALIDFCEQADETSNGISELLEKRLDKVGLSLERAVAYGADNASVNSYFRRKGEEECEKIIWIFIGNEEGALSECVTIPECYLHFVHSFLGMFR
ncbi:hypothetical protein HPB48_024300 [Haemaphysalis longicornis]|uniref:Uncharacterized protein n=1 Tax=Haemaphysalis longicornis TaxID=44386 RepID=A0A9J6GXV6_HAELO|nr:hypothetical protein HPB48_024300 [Haemaphysalis longicornis]